MAVSKTVPMQFLVLEERPDFDASAQGNRVLECVELSNTKMRLIGKPRIETFNAVLSSPFDGTPISTRVRTITSADDSFWVEFLEFPSALVELLRLSGVVSEPAERHDQTKDIGV